MNTELLARIIRNEFDKKYENWSDIPYDLIKLAKDLNLNELANQMKNDLI